MAEIFDKIKGMATGFSPDTITGSNILDSPAMVKAALFGKVAFYMGIILFSAALFYKFYLQYKVRVTVFTKFGTGGMEIKRDMAKVTVDKQGKKKLQLFKMRHGKRALSLPVPEAKFRMKLKNRDYYFLWLDDNHQLHPIEQPLVENNNRHLRTRPQERDAWARLEDKLLEETFKKKDFLEKYMPSIIIMGSMLIAFLIFFFLSKDLAGGLATLSGSFDKVAMNCLAISGGA